MLRWAICSLLKATWDDLFDRLDMIGSSLEVLLSRAHRWLLYSYLLVWLVFETGSWRFTRSCIQESISFLHGLRKNVWHSVSVLWKLLKVTHNTGHGYGWLLTFRIVPLSTTTGYWWLTWVDRLANEVSLTTIAVLTSTIPESAWTAIGFTRSTSHRALPRAILADSLRFL